MHVHVCERSTNSVGLKYLLQSFPYFSWHVKKKLHWLCTEKKKNKTADSSQLKRWPRLASSQAPSIKMITISWVFSISVHVSIPQWDNTSMRLHVLLAPWLINVPDSNEHWCLSPLDMKLVRRPWSKTTAPALDVRQWPQSSYTAPLATF